MTIRNVISDIGPRKRVVTLLAVCLFAVIGSGCATHNNSYDPVTNPHALNFSDVDMELSEYAPPFQRSGPVITNLQVFEKIRSGITASKVKSLLGEPLSRTNGELGREWNYNLTLIMPESDNYRVCQYKVVFDDQKRVKQALWRRRQCRRIVAAAPMPELKPKSTVFTLAVLFGLDLWKVSGIDPQGVKELQDVVSKLKAHPAENRTIVVKGYAGPLASDAYNQALSLRRAKTVRDYLLEHGVQADSIRVRAFGESVPVATGCDATSRMEVAACHSDDRRVQIVVSPGI